MQRVQLSESKYYTQKEIKSPGFVIVFIMAGYFMRRRAGFRSVDWNVILGELTALCWLVKSISLHKCVQIAVNSVPNWRKHF